MGISLASPSRYLYNSWMLDHFMCSISFSCVYFVNLALLLIFSTFGRIEDLYMIYFCSNLLVMIIRERVIENNSVYQSGSHWGRECIIFTPEHPLGSALCVLLAYHACSNTRSHHSMAKRRRWGWKWEVVTEINYGMRQWKEMDGCRSCLIRRGLALLYK